MRITVPIPASTKEVIITQVYLDEMIKWCDMWIGQLDEFIERARTRIAEKKYADFVLRNKRRLAKCIREDEKNIKDTLDNRLSWVIFQGSMKDIRPLVRKE